MVKFRLSESQLRRIILEELMDHYLTQKELWSDDRIVTDQKQHQLPLNTDRRSA